jgi:hypothetical protein
MFSSCLLIYLFCLFSVTESRGKGRVLIIATYIPTYEPTVYVFSICLLHIPFDDLVSGVAGILRRGSASSSS